MNIEKTREYYSYLTNDDLCQCDYCKNFSKEIRTAYPAVTEYLQKIGVDIEKPFETMPLDPDDDGMIEYIGAQYIVMGSDEGFQSAVISDTKIFITQSHPNVKLEDEHFVIEIFPVFLKWTI